MAIGMSCPMPVCRISSTLRSAWGRPRDGITNWQRHPANPITRPGKDKFDASACYKRYAIFDSQKWLLWCNGRHGTPEEPGEGPEQIGLAIHEGEDLGFE
jgi:hypothetical protein